MLSGSLDGERKPVGRPVSAKVCLVLMPQSLTLCLEVMSYV